MIQKMSFQLQLKCASRSPIVRCKGGIFHLTFEEKMLFAEKLGESVQQPGSRTGFERDLIPTKRKSFVYVTKHGHIILSTSNLTVFCVWIRIVICLPATFSSGCPECKAQGTSRGKARPSRKPMGGIPFSLKLEGQDWQCIFHDFPLGAGQITHALPLGAGRHGFSCPLDAGRHGFSCTSPCFQFIMEDCPHYFKKNG